jgi:Tfp pilus assembly protein PilV
MPEESCGITLWELIIALILLSVIILGISSIDVFSRFHLVTSERRTQLQNEVSLALEHIFKQMINTSGNEIISGADSVVNVIVSNPNQDNDQVIFAVDTNADGSRDAVRAYRFRSGAAPAGQRNQIWYCPECTVDNPAAGCGVCVPAWGSPANLIATHIISFQPDKVTNPLRQNFIRLQVRACWDPTEQPQNGACGSPNNPIVEMNARAALPSVSVN